MKEIQKWNSRLEKFWLVIAIVSTLANRIRQLMRGCGLQYGTLIDRRSFWNETA
jgi:hypothetical protein